MLHNMKIQRSRSKKRHATAHLDAFLHRMRTNNTVQCCGYGSVIRTDTRSNDRHFQRYVTVCHLPFIYIDILISKWKLKKITHGIS